MAIRASSPTGGNYAASSCGAPAVMGLYGTLTDLVSLATAPGITTGRRPLDAVLWLKVVAALGF